MLTDRNISFSDEVVIQGRSDFLSQIESLPQRQEHRDPLVINPDRILVVEKKSRWELDQEKYGFNDHQLQDFYENAGISADKIYLSHVAQVDARAAIRQVFPEAVVIARSQIDQAINDAPQLVVALGGDNHAQWVSHYVSGDTPFIGINSDPKNSVGALLQTTIADLQNLREDLLTGTYRFIPYTRLRVVLNGKDLPLALSEVFIGDKYRMNISRYYLGLPADAHAEREQKDSGLLIATGSGSTGWFRSSVRAQYHFSPEFDSSTAGAAYHATEASVSESTVKSGVIRPADELKVVSRFNRSGVISIDSDQDAIVEFPRGAIAVISLDREPLWVVVPA